MNTVSACGPAHKQENVSNVWSDCHNYVILLYKSCTQYIYKRICSEGFIKFYLASNGRNTYPITIVRDSFHYMFKQVSGFLVFKRTETKTVKKCYWHCTHRDDVSQYSSNTSSRSTVRFNS